MNMGFVTRSPAVSAFQDVKFGPVPIHILYVIASGLWRCNGVNRDLEALTLT